jgi:hypothetical protein
MVTPAICLIKQLATTSFFGYVFGYHFIFQGLEFDDCVFYCGGNVANQDVSEL